MPIGLTRTADIFLYLKTLKQPDIIIATKFYAMINKNLICSILFTLLISTHLANDRHIHELSKIQIQGFMEFLLSKLIMYGINLKGPIPSLKKIDKTRNQRVITLGINSACKTMEFYR